LEDILDTIVVVVSVGFVLFMCYSLVKYASFINRYPKNMEENSDQTDVEGQGKED